MGIIEFVILCVVLGLVVWGTTFLPLPAPIHQVILVAVVILLIFVLLRAMGVLSGADVQIPRL